MKNRLFTLKSVFTCLLFWFLVEFSYTQSPILTNPVVEKIWGGFQFVEGPVWVDTLGLLFSDINGNTVYRWSLDSTVSAYISPSGNSNGLALDKQGRLLLAQHGERQVARREENGILTPLATHYDGKRLNSPNDLAVKSDGSIFFTDPPYGISSAQEELGYNGIYRLSPTGDLQLLDNTFYRPNGIAFSPDESKLYVAECEATRIYVWDIVDDTAIVNKRVFADISLSGGFDGMKLDSAGFLYSTGPTGIWVFSPEGEPVDTIKVPEQNTNCGWGGAKRDILYVTSGKSIYRIRKGNPPVGIRNSKENEAGIVQYYPNPFEGSIRFDYAISKPGRTVLKLYNMSGQQITTLVDNILSPGKYSAVWDTGSQPCGYYYFTMRLPGNIEIHNGIVKK
jgi:gluconolactonase